MRTPEEIKKGLECCFLECDDASLVDHCRACPYQPNGLCFRSLLTDAHAYTQRLEAQVPKWISVEERLPEEIKRDDSDVSSSDLVIVAVCDDMDNIFVADDIVCAGEWVNYPAPLFEVTHWMPLPSTEEINNDT